MGTFLSLCYTAVDTICLILFLDVFGQRRFDGLKFHLHVLEYVLLSCWIPLILSIIVGHNQALKILIILLIDFIIAKRLYTEISTAILCFFVSLEYLLSYCLSFTVGMTCSVIFGMDSNTFQASPICVIIYGIIAYSLQLFLALMFRKIMRPKRFGEKSTFSPNITNNYVRVISKCFVYGIDCSTLYIHRKKCIRSYTSIYLWIDYCCKCSNNLSSRTYGAGYGTRTTAIFIGTAT